MRSAASHLLLITCVGVMVLFSNLGGPRLWDRDEPRNAGCTVEMLARGDWMTPVFDDELRTHKPILLYWFMMSAYAVLGVSEFSARFWSAALAIGTSLMTYGIGRRLFSPHVGLWSAVILLTTLMFDVAARAATPDSLLIFWGTAAILVYVLGTFSSAATAVDGQEVAGPVRDFPHRPMAVAMYACMAMAVLAKGPVGLVLPTAVIGMYLLVRRLPARHACRSDGRPSKVFRAIVATMRPFALRHFLRTCWLMRPLTALATIAVVALPWYIAVAFRTDGEWVRGFLMDHNLGRAAQSLEGHGGSVLYYPLALLVGFFPWSVFAMPTVLEASNGIRHRPDRRASYLLVVCWIGVYLGLFTIAQDQTSQLHHALLPCRGVAGGGLCGGMCGGIQPLGPLLAPAALACLAAVGLAVLVAIPLIAPRYLPGDQWLAGLGLIPLGTAAVAFLFLRRGKPRRAAIAFAIGAVLLTTALFAVGAARVSRHQTFDTLVRAIHARSRRPEIGALGVAEPSWVFYAGRPIDHLFAPELLPGVPNDRVMLGAPRTSDWQVKPSLNAWHYLRAAPDRFVITSAQHLGRIGKLPEHVVEITRTPYFLQDDELVLLGARQPAAHTADRSDSASRQVTPR